MVTHGGQDGHVRAFEDDGTPLWDVNITMFSYGLGITPNGLVVAGCSYSALVENIRALSAADGSLVWSYDHGATIRAISSNRANERILAAGDEEPGNSYTTRLFDEDGSLLLSLAHGEDVTACALSDSGRIVTVGLSGDVKVWDSSGNVLWTDNLGTPLRCVAFGPDDEVAAGGDDFNDGTGTYVLWIYDADGNVLYKRRPSSAIQCHDVEFLEDGRVAVSVQGNPRGMVLDATGATVEWTWSSITTAVAFAISPEGRVAYVGTFNDLRVTEVESSTIDWSYSGTLDTHCVDWQPTALAPPPPAGAGEGVFIPPVSIW